MVKLLKVDDHGFVYLIGRHEWGARDPTGKLLRLKPYQHVNFTFTKTSTCTSKDECELLLRNLQVRQMDEGADDIKYNFLIGGFGTIYEGRGWDVLTRLPAIAANARLCMDIAYIGDYTSTKTLKRLPDYELISSALTLFKYGIRHGFIDKTYNITYTIPQTSLSTNDQNDENLKQFL